MYMVYYTNDEKKKKIREKLMDCFGCTRVVMFRPRMELFVGPRRTCCIWQVYELFCVVSDSMCSRVTAEA